MNTAVLVVAVAVMVLATVLVLWIAWDASRHKHVKPSDSKAQPATSAQTQASGQSEDQSGNDNDKNEAGRITQNSDRLDQAQAAEPAPATSGAVSSQPLSQAPSQLQQTQQPQQSKQPVAAATGQATYIKQAEEDVEHIFNDQFREELRNRGRLHFEKIIGENAMFLQQDLRLTTAQLNDYMKQEISAKLKEEFAKYEQSIIDAKELAIDSIEKTKQAVEENRIQLLKQLEQEFAEEKAREIKRFDENMADVINHYLIMAIGDQIDLSDQLEYILANLEANRQAIIQDIVNGT